MSIVDGLPRKVLKAQSFSLSATGNIVPAVSGRRIKVYSVKLVVDAALSVNFRSGASTALEGALPLAANGGFVEATTPPNYLFATTAGEALDLVITGTGTASGRVSFWDEDSV